jgi:hypothetical protein
VVFAESEPGIFAVTPLGRTLASDEPGSMRDMALMWLETHDDPFSRLVDTLKTGETAADLHYGEPFFDWISRYPEQVNRFSGAMTNLTTGIKAGAVAPYDFDGAGKIVDIGGADGALLAQILTGSPATTGVTFDLPHVIAEAEAALKAHGLGDRLVAEPGDFFEAAPAGADTYLLSLILRDWDDERAVTILENVRGAAKPGATIIALEPVMPASDEPHMSKMLDRTMLGQDGRPRAHGGRAPPPLRAGRTDVPPRRHDADADLLRRGDGLTDRLSGPAPPAGTPRRRSGRRCGAWAAGWTAGRRGRWRWPAADRARRPRRGPRRCG